MHGEDQEISLHSVAPRTENVRHKNRSHFGRDYKFRAERSEERKKSWFGMRSGEFGAARFFFGSKFHEFDAGFIRIVNIELPFAVATEFGFFCEFCAVLDQLCFRSLNVNDAESDVVHHAEKVFVLAGSIVKHVLKPVRTVWNLERNPTSFVVFHSAMPIRAEAQQILVKLILSGAVLHDKASM